MTTATQGHTDAFRAGVEAVGGRVTTVAGSFAMAGAIERVLREAGGERALLYEPFAEADRVGLPLALRARGIRLVEVGSSHGRTASLPVGLTGAALAVAETGSLLVGGRPGGWGLATVLPWVHVAVVRAADIRPDLPTAFAEMCERFESGERDWVWIAGPSKTADIAKTLVTGIHGPNRLEVLVSVDEAPGRAGA